MDLNHISDSETSNEDMAPLFEDAKLKAERTELALVVHDFNKLHVSSTPTPPTPSEPEKPDLMASRPPQSQHTPPGLPVEIFELIIAHLTRAEIKTLRLVCREFEAKVSSQYFRNVVVPFRSEMYSCDKNGLVMNSSSDLFSNGMRIFEAFGPHILRFALSLELDEDALAYPPVKPVQEAVAAFWGVYRWPHEMYNRYTDLEGLERTADQTAGMKTALKCLTKVTNLGLCCDAGLGYLLGPETPDPHAIAPYPVFATQDWRQGSPRSQTPNQPAITIADFNGVIREKSRPNPLGSKRQVLEKMADDAGYTGNQIDEVVGLLLESESTSLEFIDFDERPSSFCQYRTPPSFRAAIADRSMPGGIVTDMDQLEEPVHHPLLPAYLTRPQKELLLELEWAHRAMIQSYVIGLVDNSRDGCLNFLTTLTIAKIPSAHLHIFNRYDFWEGIPSLRNVSLGVIADWRRITKPTPGCIEDTPVSPVEAVEKVFDLLNNYIGMQPNIESICFEWICGGELASSSYHRNKHILPAPFFEDPESMILPTSAKNEAHELLSLPHVKHLSLKNCWSTPHVLVQTIRQMALSSLEKLELESFSLSGPPIIHPEGYVHIGNQIAHNGPLAGWGGFGGNQFQLVNFLQNGLPGAANTLPPTLPPRIHIPDLFSWAGFIEHFSPGIKIRDLLVQQQDQWKVHPEVMRRLTATSPFLKDTGRLYAEEGNHALKCLSFKSCGYVFLDEPSVDTQRLQEGDTSSVRLDTINIYNLSHLMQHCRDRFLVRILSHIRPNELYNLETAFSMETGWDGVYSDDFAFAAIRDGVDSPGQGRFSGIVEASKTKD